MGPPREHGGMQRGRIWVGWRFQLQWGRRVNTAECASPRLFLASACVVVLQWGRRVNTAECIGEESPPWEDFEASMGPPREHGGMLRSSKRCSARTKLLQWGRRVNTAECFTAPPVGNTQESLQWGRRVNTAEWRRRSGVALPQK